MTGLSVSVDGLLQWVDKKFRNRKERLLVRDVHLHNPRVVIPSSSFADDLLFEFDIMFRLVNRTPKSIDNCQYAVVVEHTTDGPTNDRLAQNFPGELNDFDGLTEPQLTPVIVRTDLDSAIQFRREGNSEFKSELSLQDNISIKFKVVAENVSPENRRISVKRLVSDWIEQCRGMDMRNFIDPMEFEDISDQPEELDDISELPKKTIGDDLNPYR